MIKQKSVSTILICNLFLSFTFAFFQPLEYIMINPNEFLISIEGIWWIQLLLAIGISMFLSLMMIILPPKIGRISAYFSLGLGLAFLAQSLLFSRGRLIDMDISWPLEVLNIFMWFGIILITTSIGLYYNGKQSKQIDAIITAIAWFLIVAQVISTTIIETEKNNYSVISPEKREHYLSREGEFTLSKENNTIIFLLDSTDNFYFNRMMKKHPEMKEKLKGWTYYSNTTSVYSRTYPSITYLLTGEKTYYDQEPEIYVEEAFERSNFLKRLCDQGTDVRVFTMESAMIGNNTSEFIANRTDYQILQKKELQQKNTISNMINTSIDRCLPSHLKLWLGLDPEETTGFLFKENNSRLAYLHYKAPDFYLAINNSGISLSDQYSKAFRFYHLWGIRPGYDWDDNLTTTTDASPEDALMGSFVAIEAYISEMKKAGIYDQATIIVMGDHGFSGGGTETLNVPAAACPLLLVKYPNADKSIELISCTSPVSQEDLFATIEMALGTKISGRGSGETLKEIKETDERTRYYYYTAFISDEDGEIALREYAINGDANKLSNWKATGIWWDIQYSMNPVSENRFSGE